MELWIYFETIKACSGI